MNFQVDKYTCRDLPDDGGYYSEVQFLTAHTIDWKYAVISFDMTSMRFFLRADFGAGDNLDGEGGLFAGGRIGLWL